MKRPISTTDLSDVIDSLVDSTSRELLIPGKTSKRFRERCQEAALRAHSICRLRDAYEKVGFVALPIRAYVEGLAHIAGINSSALLSFLGMSEPRQPLRFHQSRLVHLAQAVGIDIRQTLLHLKISFAERAGLSPVPVLVARIHGLKAKTSEIDECARFLDSMVKSLSPSLLVEWNRVQEAFTSAYIVVDRRAARE